MEKLKSLRNNKRQFLLKFQQKKNKKRQSRYEQKYQAQVLDFIHLENNIQNCLNVETILQRLIRKRYLQCLLKIKQQAIKRSSFHSDISSVSSKNKYSENRFQIRKWNIITRKLELIIKLKTYQFQRIGLSLIKKKNKLRKNSNQLLVVLQNSFIKKLAQAFQSVKIYKIKQANPTQQTSNYSSDLDFLNISQIKHLGQKTKLQNCNVKNMNQYFLSGAQIQAQQQSHKLHNYININVTSLSQHLQIKVEYLNQIRQQCSKLQKSQTEQVQHLQSKLKQMKLLRTKFNNEQKTKDKQSAKFQDNLEHILLGKYMNLSLQLQQKLSLVADILNEIYNTHNVAYLHPYLKNQFRCRLQQIKRQINYSSQAEDQEQLYE